ncbi:hypothetical protein L2Y96_18110 [Luteibacter aegosomaticola]|uniref:hypothetical protein n=1 Tax=Luteibacter aegosomaticola TaxID=2911538 RepID=UPI001FF93A98|nr:hypothetical protein [Luteibacter aegosomaticola]UPG89293.1 hypothetical protein L2Y96_18110 [Luteibacter aegosomaticola]
MNNRYDGTNGNGYQPMPTNSPKIPPGPDTPAPSALDGIGLIRLERDRQKACEGWTAEGDSTYRNDELVRAAACYALYNTDFRDLALVADSLWPWHLSWWKPRDRRENLIRAGALIAAELDRMAAAEGSKSA